MKSRVITLTDKLEYLIGALGEADGHDSAIISTKAQNGENISIGVNTFS